MKVIFLENVLHVAKAWEIKEVKSGYAQNMLFPKNLAKELTPGVEKAYKDKLKKEDAHRIEMIENRHNIIDLLDGKVFEFTLKTWANNKVYWAIWEKDLIQAIYKKCRVELTKKHISLPNSHHIKSLWDHQVFIKLGKDASAKIKIVITPE
jgi:large subunit ribosomal protein L9